MSTAILQLHTFIYETALISWSGNKKGLLGTDSATCENKVLRHTSYLDIASLTNPEDFL